MKKINLISLILIGALLAPAPTALGQRKGEKKTATATAPVQAPAAHGNADSIDLEKKIF
jgi:hypothetical protein